MQQGDFINVFLARHTSGTYAHHQEHQMLSCSIRFSAPSVWMGGGLESRCVGRVCGVYVVELFFKTSFYVISTEMVCANTDICYFPACET